MIAAENKIAAHGFIMSLSIKTIILCIETKNRKYIPIYIMYILYYIFNNFIDQAIINNCRVWQYPIYITTKTSVER